MLRAIRICLLLLVTSAVLVGCRGPDDHATGVIEEKYAAPGPQAVTVAPSSQCCDRRGSVARSGRLESSSRRAEIDNEIAHALIAIFRLLGETLVDDA